MNQGNSSLKNLIESCIEKDVLQAGQTVLEEESIEKVENAAKIISSAFWVAPDVSIPIANEEEKFIESFTNNLTLLIQKTWVEKSDADLKEQVLYQLEQFCALLKEKSWDKAYTPFLKVIYDVVYLMFGAQAKKDDFFEYAVRVDPGFGIFWWYIQLLPLETDWSAEKCRIIVLLGMFFLANY